MCNGEVEVMEEVKNLYLSAPHVSLGKFFTPQLRSTRTSKTTLKRLKHCQHCQHGEDPPLIFTHADSCGPNPSLAAADPTGYAARIMPESCTMTLPPMNKYLVSNHATHSTGTPRRPSSTSQQFLTPYHWPKPWPLYDTNDAIFQFLI